MLTLHYAKGTAAMAPHIALEDAGIAYDATPVDFSSMAQQSPGFLAINPKGRVPALVTAEGILTETPAILAYIAQAFPAANLAPATPFAFAEMQAFNAYLCSTVHVAHAHRMRGARWSDDPDAHATMQAKVPENVTECAGMIETHYLRGPWVMGDHYTVADAYLHTIARWMPGDGVDMSAFPRLTAHTEAMAARPGVQKVVALHS